MKILYWNLHNNSNISKFIIDCIKENDIDVFICSEFKKVDLDSTVEALQGYCISKGLEICNKIRIIHKECLKINIVQEQERYLLATYKSADKKYLITAVHLPANPYCKPLDRINVIQKIISDIMEYEKENFEIGQHRTLVIGDMNASPFDQEMISKTSFNSVLFRDLINKASVIQYQGQFYERFYNPIIDYIGDKNQAHGSFYYSSSVDALYWYCYDQILLRKELIDSFLNLKYLKKIGSQYLIKETKPNDEISDHLPLLVEMNI